MRLTSLATLSPNNHPAPRGETAHVSTSADIISRPLFLYHNIWWWPTIGITPDQVTEGPLMRNLLSPGHDSNLVQGSDFRRESSVNTQHASIDDGGQRKEIKDLAARLPHTGVAVLGLAFLVEAVDLGDLAGLVVAADQGDSIRISGWC